VVLHPAEGWEGSPVVAEVGEDSIFRAEGVLPGLWRVTVQGKNVAGERVPEEYTSPATTPLSFDVKQGKNYFPSEISHRR
jgi:hypothetical protein